jgi:hypothetical protein
VGFQATTGSGPARSPAAAEFPPRDGGNGDGTGAVPPRVMESFHGPAAGVEFVLNQVTFAARRLLSRPFTRFALVAQLDRASDFESEGREFESLRARQSAVVLCGLIAQ